MDAAVYRPHDFGEVRRTIGPHGYVAFHPSPLPRRVDLEPETVVALAEAEAALGRLDGFARSCPTRDRSFARISCERPSPQLESKARRPLCRKCSWPAPPMAPCPPTSRRSSTTSELPSAASISSRNFPSVFVSCVKSTRCSSMACAAGNASPARFGERRTGSGRPARQSRRRRTSPLHRTCLARRSTWERFVNADLSSVPLLAQCAIAHYQFEAIHPFLDGNGRVGRLLNVLFLAARGRLTEPVLYLSPYLERRRDQYVGHLQAVHERGEVDPWIAFLCAAVADQANEASRRAQKLESRHAGGLSPSTPRDEQYAQAGGSGIRFAGADRSHRREASGSGGVIRQPYAC